MFKATEFERKFIEINLIIGLQINLSWCRTSDLFLAVFPTIVMGMTLRN